ncbi:hypothetical protein RchiOBHm_Chr1g0354831 [Rosa chinensis]|uniref:Uncharacterized protein n=1 Tax=Rosa chinensis TaxID=74649 RepID=A0A2P6SH75_ROSCH|nr:hypothetical protein RchiOBHm_Chr1g0354831 [Rosa chinensis]
MLSCQIETEMDLNSETNLEMGIYMGLQRKVSQSLKLETWRLASLCEQSAFYIDFGRNSGALRIGELFNSKGRHIVGIRQG